MAMPLCTGTRGQKAVSMPGHAREREGLVINSDLSQTSHCNIKGLSVSEVMRIENMITQGNTKGEFVI